MGREGGAGLERCEEVLGGASGVGDGVQGPGGEAVAEVGVEVAPDLGGGAMSGARGGDGGGMDWAVVWGERVQGADAMACGLAERLG